MRGFLHISEAIIVIMLVFVMIFQFASIPGMRINWEKSKLVLMSHDILYSLDRSGVDWFNSTEIGTKVGGLLPSTIGFSLSTRQDIRPVMRVGCVCDPQNFSILQEEILTDFELNGLRRSFIFERVDPATMKFSAENDVIVFWGYRDIGSADLRSLKSFLQKGGGVVEFSSLQQYQADQQWHKDIYNLIWVDSTYLKTAYANFYPLVPADPGYKVKKFFQHLPYELSPEATMAGYWRMNLGRGDTAWDTSSESNDGMLMDADEDNADGNQTARWVGGKFGYALLFDGTDDYVEVPDSSSLKFLRYTTEAWFRIEKLPEDGESFVILEKGEGAAGDSNFGISLLRNSSMWDGQPKLACSFTNETGDDFWLLYDMSAAQTKRFVQVACTLNGNEWRMFVNGQQVSTAMYSGSVEIPGLSGETPSITASPLYMGARYDKAKGNLTGFFRGIIDEVIIYRRVLAPEEILGHFQRRFPSSQNFENFARGNLYPADNSSGKIVVEQESRYIDGPYQGLGVPLSVINWGVEGSGRSAWMSSAPLTPENKQLLKSLVVWAAGEKDYEAIQSNLKDSVKATLQKALNGDMYEPMSIDLTLGFYY